MSDEQIPQPPVATEVPLSFEPISKSIRPSFIIILVLFALLIGAADIIALLSQHRLDLADRNNEITKSFLTQLAEGNVAFTDSGTPIFPDEQKFLDAKQNLVEQKKDFIEADLSAMELTLYQEGVATRTFMVLGIGKEGSWWETPTGSYSAIVKEENHYSSIGKVWMPWSIQFYGNFFIHGWPYHNDGTFVPKGYSGGCIRLSTDDAKVLYENVTAGMPIIVREFPKATDYGTADVSGGSAPAVAADAFLVSELVSGKTLLGKNKESVLPVSSLSKLMTAVVASELVYLERTTLVKKEQLTASVVNFDPQVGDRYIAFDLLYPLLMQSSDQSANILAGFLGNKKFVTSMNQKSVSIGMNDTHFADPSGKSIENTSSSDDMLKLLKYIYFKRRFLFDVSKGESYRTYSGLHTTELTNFSQFASDTRLVGLTTGTSTPADRNLASVWEFSSPSGPVPVAVIVLGSGSAVSDTKALVGWVEKNVEFK